MPLGVVESPGPRLYDSQVHQRDPSQLTTRRDLFVRFVCDRHIEQVHLFDYLRELTTTPCQRQPQRGDGHREAPAASWRSALGVGIGQRQLSSRFLQPPLGELNCCMSQGQLRMIG